MRDHSGANHVQIDINKTTVQVLVSRDRRRMIAIFPECAMASFPLIVFLPSAAGDQLHAIRDNVWTDVSNQKVNVVARHDVIKYRKTKALLRFKNPAQGMWIRSISSIGNRANSIPKRFERSEAVERLERFEPNVVGWLGMCLS
jgi:hypothetical protein